VLECVPSALAKKIAGLVSIPVIGIGAGVDTDGQILVMHDMLGVSANYMPKFSKNYLAETGDIRRAVSQYIAEVQAGTFPGPEHSFDA
jgi:3-methyl-2-oxobutanoate hydroxymethyltransferase